MLRRVRWFVIFATALIIGSLGVAVLGGTAQSLQIATYEAVLAAFLLVAELVTRS